MVTSTFLVVGCLLSSSALAASVHEPRPQVVVPPQENFIKESKFNAPPPPPRGGDLASMLKDFDLKSITEGMSKDGKFDWKSMAEKLPKDLLKKSSEAMKDGKFDVKNVFGEGKGFEDILGGAGEDKENGFDFGNIFGAANPEERDASLAKMMGISVEEFKEQQRKTKEMMEKAKNGKGKFDWSSFFGGSDDDSDDRVNDDFEL